MNKRIFSIGHSNRTLPDFERLLHRHGITTLVDVRRYPHSQRHPQFDQAALCSNLEQSGYRYLWLGDTLGGMREQAYDQYMQSRRFQRGLAQLLEAAEAHTVAFMCAEKLVAHCHRRFIADELARLGWLVTHIIDRDSVYMHQGALL